MHREAVRQLTDATLLAHLDVLLARDRDTTVEILIHLAEVDRRRLYVSAGCSSMFRYCVERLHFSEDVAYKRIRAARIGRRFPQILAALRDGRLHLAAVVSLSHRLRKENVDELLRAATHRTRGEIERMLAGRFPQPDVPTVLRALPGTMPQLAPGPVGVAADTGAGPTTGMPTPVQSSELAPGPVVPVRPAVVAPLAPRRFALQVTIDQETHDKLRRAQDLVRFESRDVSSVLGLALDALLTQLEKTRFAATTTPHRTSSSSANSRTIPADVRRAVAARDQSRCTFVSDAGQRCTSRRVEFDHVIPVSRGGRSTVGNVRLLCRAHNQYAADRLFGRAFMTKRREATGALAASGATGSSPAARSG